jgi:hypothetical protein
MEALSIHNKKSIASHGLAKMQWKHMSLVRPHANLHMAGEQLHLFFMIGVITSSTLK